MMSLREKIQAAKNELINSRSNWTPEAINDFNIGAEIAEIMLEKKISASDARHILKRTGQIIDKVKIG